MRVQKTGRPDYRPDGSQGWGSGTCPPLQGDYLMSINIGPPQVDELKPRIAVIGVGGAGGNAIANMIAARVEGVDFVVANTDRSEERRVGKEGGSTGRTWWSPSH